MPDSILLPAITLQTKIGVPDAERAQPQTVIISVEIVLNTSKAGASDTIADTIDYETVTQDVLRFKEGERKTAEKLAEDIAQMILTNYKPISVKVSVRKEVPAESGGVVVRVERDQKTESRKQFSE